MELDMLVLDFDHNPRHKLAERFRNDELDELEFIRIILRDFRLKDSYRDHIIITPDGKDITYIHGGYTRSGPIYPPKETGRQLELKVGQIIARTFENPRIRVVDRSILGFKVGTIEIRFDTEIYPHNTLLAVDRRFEEIACKALDGLNIEPNLHYDHMQLPLFELSRA